MMKTTSPIGDVLSGAETRCVDRLPLGTRRPDEVRCAELVEVPALSLPCPHTAGKPAAGPTLPAAGRARGKKAQYFIHTNPATTYISDC